MNLYLKEDDIHNHEAPFFYRETLIWFLLFFFWVPLLSDKVEN